MAGIGESGKKFKCKVSMGTLQSVTRIENRPIYEALVRRRRKELKKGVRGRHREGGRCGPVSVTLTTVPQQTFVMQCQVHVL